MRKHELYNAGIYCRLSKDDIGNGDSSSITTQKEMLSKYVRDNGWRIVDYYVEISTSSLIQCGYALKSVI